MGVDHNAMLVYGFPAEEVGIKVSVALGETAPPLRDWLEKQSTWQKRSDKIEVHWLGMVNRYNDSSPTPSPFIGVVLAETRDYVRSTPYRRILATDLRGEVFKEELVEIWKLLFPGEKGPAIDYYIVGSAT